jgi:hypothetical protein
MDPWGPLDGPTPVADIVAHKCGSLDPDLATTPLVTDDDF